MRKCFFLFVFAGVPFSGISKPIHKTLAISIGGINQWIKMDSEDDTYPILLFLHGGPGNSVTSYASKFTDQLQQHFILVLWDQRETGETKKLNTSPLSLNVTLFESDAVEVIHYLRERFHQDKIYLAGHSWGGFLALQVASHHAHLLAACLAAAPMVNQLESERLALQEMKEVAAQEKNTIALQQLTTVQIPFKNGKQLYFHRKWLSELIDRQKAPFSQAYVENWAITWLSLFNEASFINFSVTAPDIKCPIYFLVGVNDYQTCSNLTKNYFEKLKAPKKELFWFSQSAHLLNLTESKKFQEIIISTLAQ